MDSILITGGAGFIGSHCALTAQEKWPDARITVLDDFRSGDFKNLEGFRGDVVAMDLADLDLDVQFGNQRFDAVFHMASITDTRDTDQGAHIHDNVEGFRNLLTFLAPQKAPVVYASSAATYGIAEKINRIGDPPKPANVYAFSKVIMDNLADTFRNQATGWEITGLKFFNVYGPKEAHKGVPASMILHLARQMQKGERPRIFEMGEQKRDFIYITDVINMIFLALEKKTPPLLNIGTGQPRSFNELVQVLNRVLGTALKPDYIKNPYPFYQPHTEADISETQECLECEIKFPLEKGIQDYAESGCLLL